METAPQTWEAQLEVEGFDPFAGYFSSELIIRASVIPRASSSLRSSSSHKLEHFTLENSSPVRYLLFASSRPESFEQFEIQTLNSLSSLLSWRASPVLQSYVCVHWLFEWSFNDSTRITLVAGVIVSAKLCKWIKEPYKRCVSLQSVRHFTWRSCNL